MYGILATEFKDANGNIVSITEKHISWNYKTKGNDFTNVTGEGITVTGTLEGTYDATSDAYGYKGTTASETYIIQKKKLTSATDFAASMKTTSVEYTGSAQKFGKSDITLQAKVDANTKVDISDAIKKDATFTGETEVGSYTLKNISTDKLDATATVLKNFEISSVNNIETTNKYEIKARDLSKCSVESDIELNIDDVKDKIFDITSPNCWNKVFKKSIIDDKDIRFQSLTNANDVFFTYAALLNSKKISIIKKEQGR